MQFQSHDVSTRDGRTAERHRRVFWSAFAGVASKGIGMLNMLITVPLTVHYLGPERYAMWMTLSSIIALFAFADLGLGNGLTTSVSRAHGAGDHEEGRRLISTAFLIIVGLTALLAMAFLLAWPHIRWASIYNVASPSALAEAGPATGLFVACSLLLLPFSIAERVRSAFQSAFSHSLWVGLGQLVSLACLLIAIHRHAGLPWLVLAVTGCQLLAGICSFVSFFFFERPSMRPKLELFAPRESRLLFHTGALFLVLEVAVVLSQASDYFILTQILGADAVTRYSIASRVYSLAPMLLALLTTPLWPAYGEAIARGDAKWVKQTFTRSLALVVTVAMGASATLLFVGRWLVAVWVGSALTPSMPLMLGLALWAVLQPAGHATGMLLNAARVIRFQVICATILGVVSIALKLLFTRTFGLSGVAWGAVVAYVPILTLTLWWFIPRLFDRMGAPAPPPTWMAAESE